MLRPFTGKGSSVALGRLVSCVVVMSVFLAVAASPALAETVWRATSAHGPQNMPPGGTGQYTINVYNIGDLNSEGPVTVVDTLPVGVTVQSLADIPTDISNGGEVWDCSGTSFPASTVTCTTNNVLLAPLLSPFDRGAVQELTMTVSVDGGNTGTANNTVTVSGGGASAEASTTDPTTFSDTPASFGPVAGSYQADFFDGLFPAGSPARQAGSHPFEMRVDFTMNLALSNDPALAPHFFTQPVERIRTLITRLPRGFVGSPAAAPTCPMIAFNTSGPAGKGGDCPANAQVGVVSLILQNGKTLFLNDTTDIPVYNVEPPAGAVAAFAFAFRGNIVLIKAALDPTDYSVIATIYGVNELFAVRDARMTLWGVPSDPAHDPLRMNPQDPTGFTGMFTPSTAPIRPFLTLPPQCGVDGAIGMSMDSWQHPGDLVSVESAPMAMTGCEDVRFRFDPSIAVQPESLQPNVPTGLDVNVSVPQKDDSTTDVSQLYSQSGNDKALPTPPLKKAVVTLPAGLAVNPSSANGLGACTKAQIGLGSNAPVACPEDSKIGSVELETPLLEKTLEDKVGGTVYLATQNANPFGSLIALYMVLEDPARGLLVKLPGKVDLGPTGQLTATFDENPQLPFSQLHLHFKGGSRAPLMTSSECGSQSTSATFTSWNGSLPAVQREDSFTISGDGQGGACAPRSFAPGFTAGTRNPAAGGFAPFALRLTRTDGDSELGSLSSLRLPRGLLADVRSVSVRCTDAQASAAACPAASHIGEVTVGAGGGSNPVYVGGDVYLTGPYKGAPFGLAIVVHATAGPFDLGYVTVRAAVQINMDGTVTTKSDPFPTILQGIPLRLRDIRVNLDRPHFMLNPTNCTPMSVNGSVSSTTGQTATVSTRFQVGECRNLSFHPSFRASTGAKASRTNGASLRVVVKSGAGQANIRSVKVKLPKQLASRLTTLQQACTEAVFAQNPAGCPAGSRVGVARAVTPILASPLAGPAYFVSHGGAKFPELVVVLEGEGVTIDLAGETFIAANGITSSTFRSVPDAPISSFELSLPTGPHSALGSKANLCKSKLAMPTLIAGQNGAVIKQSTKIAVSGCAKHKTHNGRGGGR